MLTTSWTDANFLNSVRNFRLRLAMDVLTRAWNSLHTSPGYTQHGSIVLRS